MAKRSKLDVIPPIIRGRGRIKKANARSAENETRITRHESQETEKEKLAAIHRIAEAEAIKDNHRIVSSDSATVYQVVQAAQTMRKGGTGIRVHRKHFVNMNDVLAELRGSLEYRFRTRQIECTYDGEYLTLYRNF